MRVRTVPRLAIPLWAVLMGLIASYLPTLTIGGLGLLMFGGIVAPATCVFILSRWHGAIRH